MIQLTNFIKNVVRVAPILAISIGNASADDCSALKSTVETYRSEINANQYSQLMKSISFPLSYVMAGRVYEVKGGVNFSGSAKYIFNQELKDVLNKADTCTLANIMGVTTPGGPITKLVYDLDPADTIYTSYGISSASKLYAFLDKIKSFSDGRDYASLADYYRYPFNLVVNGARISIASKADFINNGSAIVNTKFVELINNLIATKHFDGDYNGLMLDAQGDYWIVSNTNGQLLLQANNPTFATP